MRGCGWENYPCRHLRNHAILPWSPAAAGRRISAGTLNAACRAVDRRVCDRVRRSSIGAADVAGGARLFLEHVFGKLGVRLAARWTARARDEPDMNSVEIRTSGWWAGKGIGAIGQASPPPRPSSSLQFAVIRVIRTSGLLRNAYEVLNLGKIWKQMFKFLLKACP